MKISWIINLLENEIKNNFILNYHFKKHLSQNINVYKVVEVLNYTKAIGIKIDG